MTLLGVVCIVIATSGCASIDPTEQFFAIGFRNDIGRAVILKACGDKACEHFTDTWKMTPGDVVKDNISDQGVVTRWLVDQTNGTPARCLPLAFRSKYSDIVVRISQAEACPGRTLSVEQVRHGP